MYLISEVWRKWTLSDSCGVLLSAKQSMEGWRGNSRSSLDVVWGVGGSLNSSAGKLWQRQYSNSFF